MRCWFRMRCAGINVVRCRDGAATYVIATSERVDAAQHAAVCVGTAAGGRLQVGARAVRKSACARVRVQCSRLPYPSVL